LLVVVLVVTGGGFTGSVAASASAAAAATGTPSGVRFDFESGPARGRTASAYDSVATGRARLVVRSTGGTTVTVSAGPRGGRGVRFPAWADSGAGRAAVLVSTPGSRAAVAPGARAFSFGASFRLNPRSSGSARDNGDNLVQRGTYGGRGQFKIQLDRRVPSCRVKGDAGARTVMARRAVATNRWYAVTCRRTATGLQLSVQGYAQGAPRTVTRVTGRTGNIVTGEHRFSVGGKVPRNPSDQFNRAVANVYVRLG